MKNAFDYIKGAALLAILGAHAVIYAGETKGFIAISVMIAGVVGFVIVQRGGAK